MNSKFTIEERVRWGDVDAASIIFYGSYIRFFEIAETLNEATNAGRLKSLGIAVGLPTTNAESSPLRCGLVAVSYFEFADRWQRGGARPSLPRVHLECDFLRAPRLDDLLEVSVYVGKIGRTSLRLDFEVRRKTEDGTIEKDLMATAHFVLVSTDRSSLKPLPVPKALTNALAPFTQTMS